ncbi:MAG: DUF2147 domain-containing protein [Alphaproteobacteria bacterium]|nr:DUF2147 domain-containing protein [Alphaproteobacteria bacterium]
MRKSFLYTLSAILFPVIANAAMPFVGTYQTIDDETNTPKSIVQIYEYKDGDDTELAGRIIALYGTDGQISETLSNPTRIAEKVKGKPTMVGLDIIWDMEWDDDDHEYEDGKIMDPKSGKIYSSVMWQEKPSVLNVRGKIGPFGRTQKWNTMDNSKLPADLQNLDTSTWKPAK